MTIMSSYLTIHSVVNARASVLHVMLAPPTKHFLGPASAGSQPFVAAPRMVPAHVQSDSMMKDTRHQVSHYLKVSAALTQPSWTFLPESSPSHRFLLPETDKAVIIVQYLTKWLSICENIRTHHKVWQKLRIGSTCPRRLPQLRSQHYAHNSVLQTQLILRDEKLVYICETYQGQTIGLYDHHVQLSDHSICCECSRK